MLEPLIAVSVAANVIQFVQFGLQLLSESREIWNSAKDASSENLDIENVYGVLQSFSTKLQGARVPDLEKSKEEQALEGLSEGCKQTADELLRIIHDLRVKGEKHRRWQSFCQALRSVRKRHEIDGLRRRLDEFSLQLTLQFVAMSR